MRFLALYYCADLTRAAVDLNFMDYSLLIGVKRERFTVVDSQKPPANDAEDSSAAGSHKPWSIFGHGHGDEDMFKRDCDGGMRARIVEGPGTYYIGIIDILQEWNFSKRLERFFKMYCKLLDGDGLSAMSPTFYADRFWKRCVVDTFEGIEFDDNYINVRSRAPDEAGVVHGGAGSLFGTETSTVTASTSHSIRSSTHSAGGAIYSHSEVEQFVRPLSADEV